MECPICMEPMTTNNQINKWTCKHAFHVQCIEKWNKDCPICRSTTLREEVETVTWCVSREPNCPYECPPWVMDRQTPANNHTNEYYNFDGCLLM